MGTIAATAGGEAARTGRATMAELKTRATRASATAYIGKIEDEVRREDCRRIAALMAKATGSTATMWGESIIGFGARHYRYASGREGDWFAVGLASRRNGISVYLSCEDAPDPALLKQLGKHKMGKGCLTIARLADVDVSVLERLIRKSVAAATAA
jgi:hypothetical protein